ncbi:MAG: hypothetical protein JWM68_2572 [Verrucomicrobiales bacterium]|nr:hypothetical protein [Verrucomicrobiales bacterium]
MTFSIIDMVFVALAIAASVGIYLYRRFSAPPFLLQRWAKDQAFRILHSEYRYFSQGPFTWRLSHRGVSVYYVRVRDLEGLERCGWVRCSSCWGTDKTEVHWDDTVS